MVVRTLTILFFGITLLLFLAFRSTSGLEPGLKQLATDFRIANQAETIEPMLELYHLEGSDSLSRTLLKGALQSELGLPIQTIEFEPLSGAPEETIQFIHNGTPYGPTLKPQHRMRVTYKGKDRLNSLYTIGKTESGDWKFILAKPDSALDD